MDNDEIRERARERARVIGEVLREIWDARPALRAPKKLWLAAIQDARIIAHPPKLKHFSPQTIWAQAILKFAGEDRVPRPTPKGSRAILVAGCCWRLAIAHSLSLVGDWSLNFAFDFWLPEGAVVFADIVFDFCWRRLPV